jgi:hypothetical protein
MENLNVFKNSVPSDLVSKLIELDKKCFPGNLFMSKEDLEHIFSDPKLILHKVESEGRLLGYTYGVPLTSVFKELSEADPDLVDDPECLYVYSTATDPDERSLKMFFELIKGIEESAILKGYSSISRHSRTTEGYSSVLKKKFKYNFVRTLDDWMESGESFDYLVKDLKNLD